MLLHIVSFERLIGPRLGCRRRLHHPDKAGAAFLWGWPLPRCRSPATGAD